MSGPPPRKIKTNGGPPPRRTPSLSMVIIGGAEMLQKKILESQGLLLEVDEDWKREWKGMPSYNQDEQEPFMSVKVHFNNYDDAKEFAAKLGLKITPETRYLWYPKINIKHVADKRYVSDL